MPKTIRSSNNIPNVYAAVQCYFTYCGAQPPNGVDVCDGSTSICQNNSCVVNPTYCQAQYNYPPYNTNPSCYNFQEGSVSYTTKYDNLCRDSAHYYSGTCATPVPNGNCSSPIINSLKVHDNTTNIDLLQTWTRPLGDNVTASATVYSATGVLYLWTVVETNPSNQTTTWPPYTSSSFSFNLNTAPGSQVPGGTYKFSVTLKATNSFGSSTSSPFIFYTWVPDNVQCNTLNNVGTMTVTDIVNGKVDIFDNNPTNGCQTGYYTPNPPTNSLTTIGSNANSSYNSAGKDSLLYYPGRNDTLIESNVEGSVYVVHWDYQQSSEQNIIIPSSVTAIKLAYDNSGQFINLHDMDMDTLGPNGSPLYFWISSQSYVSRIPWSNVSDIVSTWLSKGAPANYTSYSPIITNTSGYEFVTSGGFYFADGIAVDDINSKVYVNIASNDGHQYMESFNATGANHQSPIVKLNLGTSSTTVGSGSNPVLAQRWRADGMTFAHISSFPNENFIFTASTNGRIIWVIKVPNGGGSPSEVGVTIVDANIQASYNYGTGFDGIEVDAADQIYIAGYKSGIWSVSADEVIKTAGWNGVNNFQGPFQVIPIKYTGGGNDGLNNEEWDDIAPLTGEGAPQVSYSPYYYTRGANTFTDGTYNISTLSNDSSTAGNAYFSSYGLIDSNSNHNTNSFANGVTPSLYNWEFNNYTSDLNTTNRQHPASAVYGYSNLLGSLCSGKRCSAINIDNGTINSTPNSTPITGNNVVYTYDATGNQHGGTLVIDGDGGSGSGITANGIILVKGNVQINDDRNNNFNSGNNRLLIIASGNVNINGTSLYSSTTGTQYEFANIGVISDGNITFNSPNPSGSNYIIPLVFKGLLISYGSVNFNGYTLGYMNKYLPSIEMDYDPAYINIYSKYFNSIGTIEEIGL